MSKAAISEPGAVGGEATLRSAGAARRLREVVLPTALVVGDALCALGGLIAGYGMRYHTPIREWGLPVEGATIGTYFPLLLLGAAMLMATYAYLGLYDPRLLLRRVYTLALIMKAMAFWLAAYLGLSLVLRFDPPISRLFVLVAFGVTLVITYAWRNAFYLALSRTQLVDRVKQRVAILGSEPAALEFAREIGASRAHPFALAGFIGADDGERPAGHVAPEQWLGRFSQLEWALRRHRIDVLVLSTLALPREALAQVMASCERTYVELKVIPSSFDLFVSNLQLESQCGLPLLGVGALPARRLFHRLAKRAFDVVGAAIGLVLSAPVIAVSAWLIRRESPGPVLFRQARVGAEHRTFVMLKLRTMHVGAEAEDAAHQSTARGDPRVLRIGRWLRRWNIDELPQFWNVLRGDMSLVGPRPERPYHVDQLSDRIRHYLPRHLVKPGMTGWAQVNGCRGEGDLERRTRCDIYYIENWSLGLDLQVLVLTLLRWRNPSE